MMAEPDAGTDVVHTDPKETLRELQAGILLWSLFCQVVLAALAGFFFRGSGVSFAIGLWAGCAGAMIAARHMLASLDRALDLPEGAASRKIFLGSLVRYGIMLAILLVLALTGWGNPLAAFAGLMGLKIGAYLQPVIHKYKRKKSRS